MNIQQKGLKVRGKVKVRPREIACYCNLENTPIGDEIKCLLKEGGLIFESCDILSQTNTQLVYSHIYMGMQRFCN